MDPAKKPEVWLRGPLPEIPSLLQPVAHALLQALEDVRTYMQDFPEELLWERPAGVAAVGFHLKHIAGVIDRLFTYAQGLPLTPEQFERLASEEKPLASGNQVQELLQRLDRQVDKALAQLRATDEEALTEPRGVGRAKLPTTVLGLLMHAAEHSQRHVGQLLVTARVVKNKA